MNARAALCWSALVLGVLLNAGCATVPPPDYSIYQAHKPRSILVLPPLNETTRVEAPYIYLSTITRPIAECGYYVFPVAVIDAFMKENGLPSAEEMHQVPLNKIREILGADAVLYVTIEEWGQKYLVLDSVTVVRTRFKLVDVATGSELWSGQQYVSQSATAGSNNAIAMLIVAAASQIIGHLADRTHEVSRLANFGMVYDPNRGFLRGNYRPISAQGTGNVNDTCAYR